MKKRLTAAVLAAIGMTFVAQAAEPVTETSTEKAYDASARETFHSLTRYALDEYIVTGVRDRILQGGFARTTGDFGILGEQDIMDVPFSAVVLGPKNLESFASPNMSLDKVLVNNPAIRAAGSNLHNDFTYRGFRANGTSSLVNGIPGLMTQFNAPTYMIDHIEMLNGPSGGLTGSATQYESTAVGGMVNFVTKKAGDENRITYKQTFTGRSNFGSYIDASMRFGKNREWGLRINTELVDGETAIRGENINSKSIAANIDRETDRSKTNLFMMYRDTEVTGGQRWFKLGSAVTTLPTAPSGTANYSFDGMYKSSYGYVFGLNHEQKLNDHWKVFVNAGYNHNVLDNNVMAQNSAYTLTNAAGDYNLYYQIGGTPQNTYYTAIGTTASYKIGKTDHDITLTLDHSWKNRETAKSITYPGVTTNYGNLGTGNIYTGIVQTADPITSYSTARVSRIRMKGISVMDNISFDKWNVLLGVHHHSSTVSAYSTATGANTSSIKSGETSPTFAVTYKPNDNVSVYASHSEYFDAGVVVGNTYQNAGQILPPAKAKQNEIGVKYMKNSFLTSLAYFDIEQAVNVITQTTENGVNKMWQYQDGLDHHKGLEWSFNGRLTDKWSVFGGAMYLNAKREKTDRGLMDGKRVSAQPRWSGVLGLEYAANDNIAFLGRMTYFGSSIIRNGASVDVNVPSYAVFDAGVKYKTVISDVPTTFNLMVYNVFNKDYWMPSRGDQVYVSSPRTLMLSAQLDF